MVNSILIEDVRIFDGETEIPNGSVLVENGQIVKVSDTQMEPPNTLTVVLSKPGHTLIPGFIDAHVHAPGGTTEVLTQSLKFGATTVCDMQGEPDQILKLRAMAAEDSDAADFKSASHGVTIANGWPAAIVLANPDLKEARANVAAWPKLQTQADVDAWINDRVKDADYVKLFHEDGKFIQMEMAVPTLEIQRMAVKAAHDHGMLAVAHATSLQGAIDILRCGADGTTHTIADQPPTQELIDAFKLNNAHCNPTLATIGSFTKEGQKDGEAYAKDPRVQRFLTDARKGVLCQCGGFASSESRVEYAYESVRMMKAAGIDVIVGTDATGSLPRLAFGISVHHEMALLVSRCGFTPAEALRSATHLVAKRLRLGNRGRIAEGFRADLVLVEGNPMENIDDSLNLRGVWKQGILCSSYTI